MFFCKLFFSFFVFENCGVFYFELCDFMSHGFFFFSKGVFFFESCFQKNQRFLSFCSQKFFSFNGSFFQMVCVFLLAMVFYSNASLPKKRF